MKCFRLTWVGEPDVWVCLLEKPIKDIKKLNSYHGQVHITMMKSKSVFWNLQFRFILFIALCNVESHEIPSIHIECCHSILDFVKFYIFFAILDAFWVKIITHYL